jgi:hypothetical protein
MKRSFYRTAMIASLFFTACANNESGTTQTETAEGRNNKAEENGLAEERLRRFDSLDFQFYNNQQWDSLAISHADNIKVYYPDGTTTEGLSPEHINKLTPLFAFAPDTKITSHPIKFASGEWTTVIGEMEGTFSKPLDMGNGTVIQPTGKKFKLRMCTIGKWNGGKMTEEHLFWDNAAMMQQIGVAQ